MRAGGCTVQQALTAEAATVVKQSVNLAKRRGHAQVTPLHVASMMLSSASLLRAACLQSHSHPLQCKALELCFNVALNRLPTSSTILAAHTSPHHHIPTLSNALIAAFKRAQAHQRRGGVECQQQPLLTVKIELGQLIISILDDPSVSRVMREAGFSSTQVKIHVETAVMVEASSAPDKSTNSSGNKSKDANFAHGNKVMSHVRSEDVARVLDCFSSGNKRSVIVVGECVSLSQGVIKVVMDKIAKGEVQEDLRNTQLIPLPLSPSNIMTREEVDSKVVELKSLVRSCCLGRRGALFVIEDFKWACEAWQFICQEKQIRGCANYTYSPVAHMIMEISSLIKSTSSERVWLLGFCTSSSYMSCKQGEPSLETLWCLHSIAVTDTGGLGPSLCESDIQIQRKSNGCNENGSCRWSFSEGIHGNHTARSVECRTNDQTDIPVWLHQHNTKERKTGSNIQGPLEQNDLRLMNWYTSANDASFDSRNLNSSSELTLSFSNTFSPSPQTNATTLRHDTRRPWPFSLEKEKSGRGRGGHFWQTETNALHGQCTMSLHNSNPNSTANSSVSDETSNKEDYRPRFKELNAENLKILCKALESKVPWQKAIIPEIASAILQCRSGMKRRKVCRGSSGIREDTWFLFHGVDNEGKENIAREIASLVFGSQSQFVLLRLGTFVPTTRCTSPDNTRTKRSRIEHEVDYLEQVFQILHQNPRCVIFIKDIDQLDYNRKMRLARAIRDGVIPNADGKELSFHDSIVILSCDALFLRSHSSSPHANINKVDHEEHVEVANAKEPGPGFGLDLNLCVNDDIEECCFDDDVGLLEVVDQVFWFKLQEIL